MTFPVVLKYQFTSPAEELARFERVAKEFKWRNVRVYPHPKISNRGIAESTSGMPGDMLTLLVRTDPFYVGLREKYIGLIREAQEKGETVLPTINNEMVKDGFAGRIALDYAVFDVVGKVLTYAAPNCLARKVHRLTRNYKGQMMLL